MKKISSISSAALATSLVLGICVHALQHPPDPGQLDDASPLVPLDTSEADPLTFVVQDSTGTNPPSDDSTGEKPAEKSSPPLSPDEQHAAAEKLWKSMQEKYQAIDSLELRAQRNGWRAKAAAIRDLRREAGALLEITRIARTDLASALRSNDPDQAGTNLKKITLAEERMKILLDQAQAFYDDANLDSPQTTTPTVDPGPIEDPVPTTEPGFGGRGAPGGGLTGGGGGGGGLGGGGAWFAGGTFGTLLGLAAAAIGFDDDDEELPIISPSDAFAQAPEAGTEAPGSFNPQLPGD